MDTFYLVVESLFNDEVIFLLFELLFLVLFLYALAKEHGLFTRKTGVVASVKRGEKSWNYFYLAYGIASVVLLQVINSAESLEGYKTIISLINLLMLSYLAFFNSWFRNKIVGFINTSKQKWER